jgi:hypothetical protein
MNRTATSARQAQYYTKFSRQGTDEGNKPTWKPKFSASKKLFKHLSSSTKHIKDVAARANCIGLSEHFQTIKVDFDETVGTQESVPASPTFAVTPRQSTCSQLPRKTSQFLTVPLPKKLSTPTFRGPMKNPWSYEKDIIVPATKKSVEAHARDASIPAILLTHEDISKGYWYVPPHVSVAALAYNGVSEALVSSSHASGNGEDGVEVWFDAPMHCEVVPFLPTYPKTIKMLTF